VRTLSANLATHLAGHAHKRCTMLRLDLVDGSTLAITDHDKNLSFDLGDGSVSYSASTGIIPSDVGLSVGFTADDIEVVGPITTTGLTTRAAILGGRFDGAVARLFQVNWAALSDGPARILRGYVAEAMVEGGQFRLKVHSEVSKFIQEIGRTITAYCDADFGDARCGFDVVPVAATVASVTDERNFTVSFSGSFADDFFNRGTVTFLTGGLAGTRPVEIFDWSAAGQIALWADLAEPPDVGDTLQLRQGCEKTRAACMEYDNIENFRGFPDVPGSDQVLRYPNPGGG
jgi:uncharacterized phage protein (TIGR02218 family)